MSFPFYASSKEPLPLSFGKPASKRFKTTIHIVRAILLGHSCHDRQLKVLQATSKAGIFEDSSVRPP